MLSVTDERVYCKLVTMQPTTSESTLTLINLITSVTQLQIIINYYSYYSTQQNYCELPELTQTLTETRHC